MQKFALFTGSCQSMPAIQYLLQAGKLACVVLVEAQPNPDLAQLQYWLQQHRVNTLQYKKNNETELIAQLDKLEVNHGLVYMFRHKLRPHLVQYFANNLVNIHPSPLPNYRGPWPLYWQLRNGEETTCLTLHQVNDQIDAGDVAKGIEVNIAIHPFDTMSCLQQKIAQFLPLIIENYCQAIQMKSICWQKQDANCEKFAPLVGESLLIIDWQKQSSKQISDMARAGNVDTGCAIFSVGRERFQLLQASSVSFDIKGIRAGTVIELDRLRGLIIKTADGAVRLDVIGTQQGLFDGYRFAVLFGLEAGMSL
ncbi:formyltransferase family protein [Pseudoalteromonas sp. SS15]|uniref:formyltransferase family protein n=1 Tax=Pseudoalteromonas sp. SS15 TaxID=3139393 RepID=UPI003BA89FF4